MHTRNSNDLDAKIIKINADRLNKNLPRIEAETIKIKHKDLILEEVFIIKLLN